MGYYNQSGLQASIMTHTNHTTQRPSGRDPRGDSSGIAASTSTRRPTSSARALPRLHEGLGPTVAAYIGNAEYGRLPAPGQRDPLTGLSRTTLSELVLPCCANGFKPPVRSVLLKKRGATRGIRLIHVPSLLEHLNCLAEETFASGQDNSTDTDQ